MNSKINKVKFLFVGVPKAGTTSIYHYLSQDNRINIPMKETFFFISDIFKNNTLEYPKQRDHSGIIFNESDYFDLYKNTESSKINGEIGTAYLYYHKIAIPKIKKYYGDDIKICIVLRNPVKRTVSAYKHFTKDLHESYSLSEALEQEEKRKKENWDFMWHYKEVSMYAKSVKEYLENFSNVKIMFFEDLKKQPDDFMQSLYNFLDIPYNREFVLSKISNPSGTPKLKFIQKAITHENMFKKLFRPVFRLFFSESKREKIRKTVKNKNLKQTKTEQDEKTIKYLETLYKKDIEELEKILNKKIELWK